MRDINNFLEIVDYAESLLDDEDQPTNFDFVRALKDALRGTPYEDRVWGKFYYDDEDDREATYIIFIDGTPAYKAGVCHIGGIHSGYYNGVSAINKGDAESKYLPYYPSYKYEDGLK